VSTVSTTSKGSRPGDDRASVAVGLAAADAEYSSDRGRNVVFAGLLLGTVVLLAAFGMALRGPSVVLRAGEPAPDFSFETFDGGTIRLTDLRGSVLVVNFWASWCKECAAEAADLEAVWQDYRDRGVVLLGINYTDTRPAALEYLARHEITYPNGPDRGTVISRAYRLTGVPETLVIDQAGNVVPLNVVGTEGEPLVRLKGPIVTGAMFSPSDLRALLDRLTQEGPGDV